MVMQFNKSYTNSQQCSDLVVWTVQGSYEKMDLLLPVLTQDRSCSKSDLDGLELGSDRTARYVLKWHESCSCRQAFVSFNITVSLCDYLLVFIYFLFTAWSRAGIDLHQLTLNSEAHDILFSFGTLKIKLIL